jgi:hydroxymethylpyrimidine pyrophosphatase-like HAD family hydrolase
MTIAVDFDGTIVEHKFPEIGKEKPFAIDTLLQLQEEGNRLILWTSREGELLEAAINYCHERGLDFYAVNSNSPRGALFTGKACTKLVADVYIDDRNIGGLPDWGTMYEIICEKRARHHRMRKKKKSFWYRIFKR